MPSSIIPQQRLSAMGLALWLAVPISTIIVLFVVTATWLVSHTASLIDEHQTRNEKILAKTAFALASESVRRAAMDYAHWDETYDQFEKSVDLKWAVDNLGPNFESSFGATHTFVFRRDGAVRYASLPAGGKQVQYAGGDAPEVSKLQLDELKLAAMLTISAAQENANAFTDGFVEIQGVPAFVSIRPIQPNSEDRTAKDKPRNALVVLKLLDAGELAALSRSFGLQNLSIGKDFLVPLMPLSEGEAKIGARWSQARHGLQYSKGTQETLLPLGFAALLMIAFAGIGWWRAVVSIRNAELRALEERAKSVQETARAKSLFVANMSHELRTPLNAIIGFSEVVKGQMFGPIEQRKYVEYANDIHLSGKHLLGIVNNILTLSKIDAQQQRIQIEDVSIADALSEALRMIAPDAAKRRIQIESNFECMPVVRADVQALVQIVINLLSNAVKFSKPGDVVTIKVVERSGRVILTTSDHGCGIPPETLAQLGRPFTQAEDPYRRDYQGTGLGLSICFALARQMDGDLRIHSEVGKGTVGILELLGVPGRAETTLEPHAA